MQRCYLCGFSLGTGDIGGLCSTCRQKQEFHMQFEVFVKECKTFFRKTPEELKAALSDLEAYRAIGPVDEVVRVVGGEWLPIDRFYKRKCSICGREKDLTDNFIFCPNCGANMKGNSHENND